jgi:hypothetical protein
MSDPTWDRMTMADYLGLDDQDDRQARDPAGVGKAFYVQES